MPNFGWGDFGVGGNDIFIQSGGAFIFANDEIAVHHHIWPSISMAIEKTLRAKRGSALLGSLSIAVPEANWVFAS
jgi:hypothetical protein